MAYLRVLVTDGRCTGSFGGRSLAEALRMAAHLRLVTFRAAWPLPLPVRLYKLGGSYYVEDGNHRVSVARYQGVKWIEAEVTEFYPRLFADLEPGNNVRGMAA